ncbi:response regulator [Aliikangiella marina]|uniref:Sensory/regulatory protein RpfC n=1 Tax=Aliikangiella marina TaxID=1712262 RepID=A0A545T1G9_9GAMM|nr:PAS domain-containing protein [Aliikangiella marina]TQV71025.1 response regulator [Aliikangiella marina]
MQKTSTLLSNIRTRYIAAIALVAILVAVSTYFLQQLIATKAEDASIVNLAGRQRMLSQMVSRLAIEHQKYLLNAQPNAQVAEQLKFSAALMLSSHQQLVSVSETNREAHQLMFEQYFSPSHNLDKRVIEFTQAAQQLAAAQTSQQINNDWLAQFQLDNTNRLLADLDQMVTHYESAAIQRTERVQNLIYMFGGFILIILVLEVFIIFRPVEKMIQLSFEQIRSLARKSKSRSDRMSLATNSAGIGVWELDIKTKQVTWDDWMVRLYGLTAETFENPRAAMAKGIHPEDLDRCVNQIKAAIRGEAKFDTEIRVIHPNGDLRYLKVASMVVKDSVGHPVQMVGINYDITDLVESEKKVKAANQKMQLAADSSGIGIWELDLKTNELIWDDWMIRLYGLTRENFKGAIQAWEEGVHPDDIERAVADYEAAVRGESKFNTEFRVRHPNGNVRHIKADAIVERNEQGEPIRMIGTNYDITERVESAEQAKKAIQRMQLAADSSGIGIWDFDIKSGEAVWDDWMIRLYGLTRESFKDGNTAWQKGVHPDDIDRVTEEIAEAIRGGKKYDTEYRVILPSGEIRHVKADAIVVRDEAGDAIQMIGTNYDITERVESERLLRKANERMQLAADSAELGMWELDLNTNQLTWDDWMFKIFKVNPEEFSGAYEAWAKTVHPDDLQEAGRQLQEALTQDKNLDNEFRIIWPNGEVRHIKAAALTRKDKAGNPVKLTGINYDVTDFKRTEEALIAARDQAEQAIHAKSAFLASMSHEIRTPMNGVLGMLGLLANSHLTEEQRHRTEVAKSSAESLLVLINDILDFSKIEADKMDLEFINFDIRRMLDEFAEGMAQQAQNKGLELILDIVGLNQSRVIGDPGRIRQIASNLVGNAIKFTEQGEVLIKAGLTELDEDNWRLDLMVSDTGIGIKQADQDKLFNAFEQVDASTTRHYGGTGLGLAIVKRLCRLMGGDVSMSSTLGMGSEFSCHIQLGKSKRSERILPRVDIRDLEVLVVDDNKTNREVLQGQLLNWGANVTLASSAEEALTICEKRFQDEQQQNFKIALVDYQMPKMDGVALGKKLRDEKRYQSMKLVMMTSMSFQGDAARMAKIGFSGYFPKPATTSDLFDALNVIVEDGEALAEAEPLLTRHYLNSLAREETDHLSADGEIDWPPDTTILIVEDNRTNQMVAQDILKLSGLESDVAANGQLALEQLQSYSNPSGYTMVLMDCQMPVMDGYETTKNIRDGHAGENNRSIPIIAMTAGAMKGDKEKCIKAGMNDYLTKPVDADALINKIVSWVFHQGKAKEVPFFEKVKVDDRVKEGAEEELSVDWDQPSALKRVKQQTLILVRLVESFIEDHVTRLEQIRAAIAQRDFATLKKIVHTEKGVAANLSANKLHKLCVALENAVEAQNEAETNRLFELIEESSVVLLQLFNQFLADNLDASAEIQITADESLASLLESIKQKLDDSMFIELEELEKLKRFAQGSQGDNRLIELSDLISRFEFQEAKQAIEVIMKQV